MAGIAGQICQLVRVVGRIMPGVRGWRDGTRFRITITMLMAVNSGAMRSRIFISGVEVVIMPLCAWNGGQNQAGDKCRRKDPAGAGKQAQEVHQFD